MRLVKLSLVHSILQHWYSAYN